MVHPSIRSVLITSWQHNQHPTLANISSLMKTQGLNPYVWENPPNHRYATRSHNYDKVLFVVDGSIEIILPDTQQRVILRLGERIDIPSNTRYGVNVGQSGAKCVEATTRTPRVRTR